MVQLIHCSWEQKYVVIIFRLILKMVSCVIPVVDIFKIEYIKILSVYD